VAPGKGASVLPYIVVKDTNSCPASKPWAVKNQKTGDVRGRCHVTEASARDQQKALYAAMKREAVMSEYFLTPVESLFAEGDAPTAEDNVRWVQAFPYDTWSHPIYGETTVTPDIAQQYVKNFKNNVRGTDIPTGYNHGEDKAKGDKASGWIRDMEARDNGLFFKVQFTPTAIQELQNGEWRYFSSEVYDEWTHPHTNEKYQYVVVGGALTNKPWVKGMLPINFSEVADVIENGEEEKDFTEWSTAYVNTLPDSSFLYIEAGGKKNSEGKTEPLSLRHLPYKDDKGKIDLPHLRNAIARAPQLVGTSDADKKALQAKAQRLLAGATKMAELSGYEAAKLSEAMAVIEKAGLDVVDESKEWEHSEHGTGNQPVVIPPEKDAETGSRRGDLPDGFPDTLIKPEDKFAESDNTSIQFLVSAIKSLQGFIASETDAADAADKAAALSWIDKARALLAKEKAEGGGNGAAPASASTYSEIADLLSHYPKPKAKPSVAPVPKPNTSGGGNVDDRVEWELRKMFDVDENGDLLEAAKLKFGELDSLKMAVEISDQERQFAEKYPQLWEEHNRLMVRDRDNAAKNFSETVARVRKSEGHALKETRQGLSARALDSVRETHKKFSEGKVTVEDFEETIKAIINGGILEFGELGSTNDGDGPTIPEIDNTSANGIANARKVFADLVAQTQKDNPNMDMMKAMSEVAKKYPDLAETYSVTLPA